MMRLAAVLLVFVFACKKEENKAESAKPPVTQTAPTTAPADGVRVVAIEAGDKGYVPDRITGKPGEKLKLKFTRTIEGECLSKLRKPDGNVIDLPMKTAVDVDVTVPETGEVKFACGMDMFYAVVVAEKA